MEALRNPIRCLWIAAFAASCGGSVSETGASPDGSSNDTGQEASPDTPPVEAADVSDTAPVVTPIKHVVVIVKENHTFDNYFGSFPGAEGTKDNKCFLKSGATIDCPKAPDRTPRDLCHSHACALTDWNEGKMNGWEDVTGSDSGGDHLAWAQYGEKDIPGYWAYAKKYTLADHFFAGELGPSFPGHTFVLAAQAGWATGNPGTDITHPYWGCDQKSSTRVEILDKGTCATQSVFPCFKIPSVPDILPAGVDWKFYGTNFYLFPEIWSMFNAIDSIRNGPGWKNVVNVSELQKDVDAKKLPNVVWIVNQDLNDEHPAVGGICAGENWTIDYVNVIMKSEYWKDTAILFTMDDFGGWYDHVPPPRQYGCDNKTPYGLGFRLPLIIMSPYAKPGYVFKEVSEHASIPKFIGKIFGAKKTLSELDPAAQDGVANDLMNAFDFTQKPLDPLVLTKRTCL